jgi:hypothetical protein
MDTAALLQILGAAHALRFLMTPASISLLATGKVHRGFYWDLSMIGVLAMIIIILRPHSAIAMAWTLLGTHAVALLPHWYLIARPNLSLSFADWAGACLRPSAIAAVATPIAIAASGRAEPPAVQLLVAAASGFAVYGVLTAWLNKPAMRAIGLWRQTAP